MQKSEWFEAVNPNGRIPALLDNREGKEPLRVFESAAILMYLAKAYDTDFHFHFKDDDLETEMISWIFFMSVSLSPRGASFVTTALLMRTSEICLAAKVVSVS